MGTSATHEIDLHQVIADIHHRVTEVIPIAADRDGPETGIAYRALNVNLCPVVNALTACIYYYNSYTNFSES